uniref:Uncharacterized protein n=1 Tax=Bracon brevicornis TaxID=1563983 RepID=A0A6V7KRQ6_9HYME
MANCYAKKNAKQRGTEKQRPNVNVACTEENEKGHTRSGIAFMAGTRLPEVELNGITFILDSGATDHIINREDLASNNDPPQWAINMQASIQAAITSSHSTSSAEISQISTTAQNNSNRIDKILTFLDLDKEGNPLQNTPQPNG